MKIRRASALTLAATVAALALAACGNGSTSAGSSSGSTSTCVANAKQVMADAEQGRQIKLPNSPPPFDKVKGDSVWLITASLGYANNATNAAAFKQAAAAVGLVPTVFDGQNNVSTWNAGIQSAVNAGAKGIVLTGVDPRVVQDPLGKAAAAGIQIIDTTNGSPNLPLLNGIKAHVSPDYSLEGKLMANYAMVESNCTGSIGLMVTPAFSAQVEIAQAAENAIKAGCPDCTVRTQEVASGQIATQTAPIMQTFVRRYPDMKVLITGSDSFASLIVPAFATSGINVKVTGAEGQKQIVQWVVDDHVVGADVVWPSVEMLGYWQIDILGRLLAGEPAVPIDYPLRLVTHGSITSVDDATAANKGFEQRFLDYWRVKG